MIDRKIIGEIAKDVLEQLNIDTSKKIDIQDILNKLDIDLEYNNELLYDGQIEKLPNGKVKIAIKGITGNEARDRFTIAHELGHYFLHFEDEEKFKDSVFYRDLSYNKEEFEANEFAASLLMPEDVFKFELRNREDENGNVKILPLAERFEVSKQAIINRGKFLNEF